MDRILGGPGRVQAGDGEDQVVRPLVGVERGQVADHRPAGGDVQAVAEPTAHGPGDFGVLDGHAELEDLRARDVPLVDRVGLEIGLDDHGVRLGQEADLMRAGVMPTDRVAGSGQVQEGRQDQRGARLPGRPERRVREDGVREADREDRVEIAPDLLDAGEDRHVRGGPALRRPVGDVAQEPPRVALEGEVPDGESVDMGPVDPRLSGRVDPASAPVGEVPEVVGIARQDPDVVARRDESADHRPPVILGPPDTRVIAVGEPGDPHRISLRDRGIGARRVGQRRRERGSFDAAWVGFAFRSKM